MKLTLSEGVLKRVLKSYTTLVAWRVALLYLLLALLRLIFFIYNSDLIEPFTPSEYLNIIYGSFKFDTVSLLYASGLWLILSLLPIRLRTKGWYQKMLFGIYMVLGALLIVVSNLADTIYFHFAQKRFTGDELIFSDNGNNATLALDFAMDNWWMLPLAVVTLLAVAYAYRPNAKLNDTPQRGTIYYPLHTLVLLICIALSIGGVRGGFGRAIRPLTLSHATQYANNNAKAYLILSNPFCAIRTLNGEQLKSPNYFEKSKLDSLYTPYHYPDKEVATTALHKGYNVMIFILESFSAENSAHLSPDLYKAGDDGYMPFLDSLMRSGVTLHKMYANGGRSICGTPSVIGSLPSLKTPFVLIPQSIGESLQMPAILGSMGYSTAFFCGSVRNTMGFAAYTKSAGIENYYGQEDYEQRHGKKDYDGAWGILDIPFTQYVGEVLGEMKEPFYATQFTISSHHPFTIPEGYEDILPKGDTKIQPVTAYTDLALKNFFETYKNEDWFKRTIFLFVADHVSSEKNAERTKTYPGNHHIVGGIYTPDGSLHGDIYDITQQSDLMPTVLGLVGNERPYFAFGRDIFNEPERPKWSVTYDGETTAYTADGVIKVEDSDLLKAYEQQYFEHLINSSFIVPEKE